MNSVQKQYDLWPLAWWQNPYVVGGIGGGVLLVLLLLFLFWWRRRLKNRRPRTVRERLLLRLKLLRERSLHEQNSLLGYTDLMRIIRDLVFNLYHITHEGLTDEEFMRELTSKEALDIPAPFIELAEVVCDEACQVKFAAESVSPELLRTRIDALVQYIEERVTAQQ